MLLSDSKGEECVLQRRGSDRSAGLLMRALAHRRIRSECGRRPRERTLATARPRAAGWLLVASSLLAYAARERWLGG